MNREGLIFKALNNCLEERSVEELEKRRGYYILSKSKKLESQKLSVKPFDIFKEKDNKSLMVKGVPDGSFSKVNIINMKKHSQKQTNLPLFDKDVPETSNIKKLVRLKPLEIVNLKGVENKENNLLSQILSKNNNLKESSFVFNEGLTTKYEIEKLQRAPATILPNESPAEVGKTTTKTLKVANNDDKNLLNYSEPEDKIFFKDTYSSLSQTSPKKDQNCNRFKIGQKRRLEVVDSEFNPKKRKILENVNEMFVFNTAEKENLPLKFNDLNQKLSFKQNELHNISTRAEKKRKARAKLRKCLKNLQN